MPPPWPSEYKRRENGCKNEYSKWKYLKVSNLQCQLLDTGYTPPFGTRRPKHKVPTVHGLFGFWMLEVGQWQTGVAKLWKWKCTEKTDDSYWWTIPTSQRKYKFLVEGNFMSDREILMIVFPMIPGGIMNGVWVAIVFAFVWPVCVVMLWILIYLSNGNNAVICVRIK